MGIKWTDDSVFLPKARADINPATWQIPGYLDAATNFKTSIQDLVDSASPYALKVSSALTGALQQVKDNAAVPNGTIFYISTNKAAFNGHVSVNNVGTISEALRTTGDGDTNATANFLARAFSGAEIIKAYDGLKVEFCNALVTIDQAGSFKFDMNGSSARFGSIFSNAYSAASAAQGYLAFKDYASGEDIARLLDGSARRLVLSDTNTFTGAGSSILALNSTTQAFKLPVMTTTQKNNIASPVQGHLVCDSTLNKLSWYNGASWETITSV